MEKRMVILQKYVYLFLLPAVLIIGIFKYFPFLSSLFHSFYHWNGANINQFIGPDNYVNLFRDKNFYISFCHIITVCIFVLIVNLIFPYLAAELINGLKRTRSKNFFKLWFIVPMVIPTMVITLLWKWIFAGDTGVLNLLLKSLGLIRWVTPWLGNPKTALGAILFIGFPWISGLPFLLYLGGLQSIPQDLYEAADIEGLSWPGRIRYINIPLLSSQRKLVITYMLIQGFQMFEQPYVMTNGGPGTSTLTPALYLYQKAFDSNQFGYSSAVGVILFLLVALLSFANQKLGRESESID